MPWREKMQNDMEMHEELVALRREMEAMMIRGGDWDAFAMRVFRFQARWNAVYREYVRLRGINPDELADVAYIPYLPVEVFQSHPVSVFSTLPDGGEVFLSSGTTGQQRSQHWVDDLEWYHRVSRAGYETLFGSFERTEFVGLLPGYLERGQSSLVHMVRDFMAHAGQQAPDQSFFLNQWEALERHLEARNTAAASTGQCLEVVIIGVTHALVQWAQRRVDALRWPSLQLRVVETGGMKGHGRERVRSELHSVLAQLSSSRTIGSEYGMTEMLSQAWSVEHGIFRVPPWLNVRLSSLSDPGEWVPAGRQGRIHVRDLANLASCAFLATSDIGRCQLDGSFEVLGRFDHAEVRGCNLMTVD